MYDSLTDGTQITHETTANTHKTHGWMVHKILTDGLHTADSRMDGKQPNTQWNCTQPTHVKESTQAHTDRRYINSTRTHGKQTTHICTSNRQLTYAQHTDGRYIDNTQTHARHTDHTRRYDSHTTH